MRHPDDLSNTEIMKLNVINESLSHLLSSVLAELELYKDKIDRKVVLQDMLLRVSDVEIPDSRVSHRLLRTKDDIIRQIVEYLEREE